MLIIMMLLIKIDQNCNKQIVKQRVPHDSMCTPYGQSGILSIDISIYRWQIMYFDGISIYSNLNGVAKLVTGRRSPIL